MEPADWIPVLHELADLADPIALRLFRSSELSIGTKPDKTLVTQADLEIEGAVRDRLAQTHPELGVYGEEHGEHGGAGQTRLIIDPIDATANFARGLPIFATLLAIEHAGEVVAGLASAPALRQRWHGARGAGAWSGDRRLQVSKIERKADAQIFHGSLSGGEAVPMSARIVTLLEGSWRQRGVGDFYQHLLVAEGCGEIAVDPIVAPWDVAALVVIVEEAGGRVTTLAGERTIYGGSLLSTNAKLHDVALSAFA